MLPMIKVEAEMGINKYASKDREQLSVAGGRKRRQNLVLSHFQYFNIVYHTF